MRASVCCVALLMAAGCQGPKQGRISEASAAPKSAEGSATRYDLGSFTIELPDAWVVADLTRKDFEQLMEQHAKQNPQISEMLPVLRQMAASGQIKLFAFDAAGAKGGFTDNLNILELPVQQGATVDVLMSAGEQQLSAMQAKGFKKGKLNANGVDLGVLTFDMPQRGARGEILDLSLVQYFSTDDGRQFVATFTSRRDSGPAFQALARAAMQTFRPK